MPSGPLLPVDGLTRRGLAGLAAAGMAALAGCTEDGTAGPVLPVDPVADPDVALAVEAWSAESRLLEQVRAVQRRHPRLRRRLDAARRVHAAHVQVLARAVPVDDLPDVPGPPGTPAEPAAALRAVARAESGLARSQTGRAAEARSGALARVLAGTAAAAAQQAHLLEADA